MLPSKGAVRGQNQDVESDCMGDTVRGVVASARPRAPMHDSRPDLV